MNEQEMLNTPIDRRIIDILIEKYFTVNKTTAPEGLKIAYNDAEFYGGWGFTASWTINDEEFDDIFLIKEYPDGFAIGVIPVISLSVTGTIRILKCPDEDVSWLFDSGLDAFSDRACNSHPVCIKEHVFMKDEVDVELANHLKNCQHALQEWCLSQQPLSMEDARLRVINWYIREVEVPILNDSSTKELVNMIREGAGSVDIDDVIRFMKEETDPHEGSVSIKAFIAQMDVEIDAWEG